MELVRAVFSAPRWQTLLGSVPRECLNFTGCLRHGPPIRLLTLGLCGGFLSLLLSFFGTPHVKEIYRA